MNLDELVEKAEKEIYKVYNQHSSTRRKSLKHLKEMKEMSGVESILYKAVIDSIEHLIEDSKAQKKRATRFSTIPKFFPPPNTTSELDMLIYSRVILGYTNLPTGQKGSRLRIGFKNSKAKEKYIEFIIKHAKLKSLAQPNFHHLCRVGCPQATHEWMYVHDIPSSLLPDKSVIAESKRLLAEYGY